MSTKEGQAGPDLYLFSKLEVVYAPHRARVRQTENRPPPRIVEARLVGERLVSQAYCTTVTRPVFVCPSV
jgi:hypothetical protein